MASQFEVWESACAHYENQDEIFKIDIAMLNIKLEQNKRVWMQTKYYINHPLFRALIDFLGGANLITICAEFMSVELCEVCGGMFPKSFFCVEPDHLCGFMRTESLCYDLRGDLTIAFHCEEIPAVLYCTTIRNSFRLAMTAIVKFGSIYCLVFNIVQCIFNIRAMASILLIRWMR